MFPGPERPWLAYYALPCTKMMMWASAALAVAFRAKMVR